MKKVLIEWVDSNILHGWQMEGEFPCSLAECETIGYIKDEDEDKIVVTQTVSSYGANMGVLAIPMGCVKSVKELRLK